MSITSSAEEVRLDWSRVLAGVDRGEEVIVVAEGRPVAKMVPLRDFMSDRREARAALLARLKGHAPSGHREWTRNELYE